MGNYSVQINYSTDNFTWQGFEIAFEATATYVHEDMVRYYKDGSGQPEYDDIDDIDWVINSVIDSNNNELELGKDNYPIAFSEQHKTDLEDAIADYLDSVEWNYPEYDDYPDPPDDDYPDEEDY